MSKCLVFVKEPMHKAKHVWMSMSKENIEKVLEGEPTAYPFASDEQVLASNALDKYFNCTICGRHFFGTVIICGKTEDGEPTSSSMDIKTFKKLFPELAREG